MGYVVWGRVGSSSNKKSFKINTAVFFFQLIFTHLFPSHVFCILLCISYFIGGKKQQQKKKNSKINLQKNNLILFSFSKKKKTKKMQKKLPKQKKRPTKKKKKTKKKTKKKKKKMQKKNPKSNKKSITHQVFFVHVHAPQSPPYTPLTAILLKQKHYFSNTTVLTMTIDAMTIASHVAHSEALVTFAMLAVAVGLVMTVKHAFALLGVSPPVATGVPSAVTAPRDRIRHKPQKQQKSILSQVCILYPLSSTHQHIPRLITICPPRLLHKRRFPVERRFANLENTVLKGKRQNGTAICHFILIPQTPLQPMKLKDDLATVAAVAAIAVLADCRGLAEEVPVLEAAECNTAEVVGMHTLLRKAASSASTSSVSEEDFAVSSEEPSEPSEGVQEEQIRSECPSLVDDESTCSSMPSLEDVDEDFFSTEFAFQDDSNVAKGWHPLHSTADSVSPLGSLAGAFAFANSRTAPKVVYLNDEGEELAARPAPGTLMMMVGDSLPLQDDAWVPTGYARGVPSVAYNYVQPLQPVEA